MDALFTDLRAAREARHLTLSDVSDATLIGIHFLEAIEEGKTDILPQAYVRAFIREYASVVGLDPADVMRRYDRIGAPEPGPQWQEAPAQPPPADAPPPPPAAPPPTFEEPGDVKEIPPKPETAPQETPKQRRDLTEMIQRAAVAVAVIVVAIVLWNVMGIERRKTQETPFQNVIKENEMHAGRHDSTAAAAGTQGAGGDSLVLQARTTDSVWIQIRPDNSTPREYLFKPGSRATWKAATRFTVTVGNAGAVLFTLNKKDLGALGKKGNVVHNVELNRQSLNP